MQGSSSQGSSSEGSSSGRLKVTVSGTEGSARLDRVLAAHLTGLSRSRLKALILAGQVSLQVSPQVSLQVSPGKSPAATAPVRDPAYHVAVGDTIIIDVPEAADPEPKGEDIALNIVFEDDDIIVIDKPAGLVVHPAAGHATGTLVNALIAHCGASLSGIGGVKRPGIVHRLDKDTSGLMVVAKNDRAHASLTAQFADHGRTGEMRRGYLAFAWGVPNRHRGTIDAPVDRHPHAREKMAVREGGREAVTHYEVREAFNGQDGKPVASLLACQLETGRTHQIRVHLAHAGHPLLGDSVYGPHFKTKANQLGHQAQAALRSLDRQALHAWLLALEHPRSGDVLHWESPLPEDLFLLQNALRAAL
jgi:23S rRNA pseudouridine1911/1915/1917 synthase